MTNAHETIAKLLLIPLNEQVRLALDETIVCLDQNLEKEIKELDKKLEKEIKEVGEKLDRVDESLKEEIKAVNESLKEEIKAVDESLKEEIKAVNENLGQEINALQKELDNINRGGDLNFVKNIDSISYFKPVIVEQDEKTTVTMPSSSGNEGKVYCIQNVTKNPISFIGFESEKFDFGGKKIEKYTLSAGGGISMFNHNQEWVPITF